MDSDDFLLEMSIRTFWLCIEILKSLIRLYLTLRDVFSFDVMETNQVLLCKSEDQILGRGVIYQSDAILRLSA